MCWPSQCKAVGSDVKDNCEDVNTLLSMQQVGMEQGIMSSLEILGLQFGEVATEAVF